MDLLPDFGADLIRCSHFPSSQIFEEKPSQYATGPYAFLRGFFSAELCTLSRYLAYPLSLGPVRRAQVQYSGSAHWHIPLGLFSAVYVCLSFPYYEHLGPLFPSSVAAAVFSFCPHSKQTLRSFSSDFSLDVEVNSSRPPYSPFWSH